MFNRIVIAALLVIAAPVNFASPGSADDKVLVWTGGIGIQEREAAPKEGTKLEFFLGNGDFLSMVHVIVKDAEGNELVNAVTDGPWMILDLEPGTYAIHASIRGLTQSGYIDVTAESHKFGYMFPSQ